MINNEYTNEEIRELRRQLKNTIDCLKQTNANDLLILKINNVDLFQIKIKDINFTEFKLSNNIDCIKKENIRNYIKSYYVNRFREDIMILEIEIESKEEPKVRRI